MEVASSTVVVRLRRVVVAVVSDGHRHARKVLLQKVASCVKDRVKRLTDKQVC